MLSFSRRIETHIVQKEKIYKGALYIEILLAEKIIKDFNKCGMKTKDKMLGGSSEGKTV